MADTKAERKAIHDSSLQGLAQAVRRLSALRELEVTTLDKGHADFLLPQVCQPGERGGVMLLSMTICLVWFGLHVRASGGHRPCATNVTGSHTCVPDTFRVWLA